MIEATTLPLSNALDLNVLVKVPVPQSSSLGIWISPSSTSGLVFGRWTLISGTIDPLSIPSSPHDGR